MAKEATMARKPQKPTIELEVPGGGGLKIALYENEGRQQAHLQTPDQSNIYSGPCIGTGLSTKTALRDVKVFLQQAINAIDENLES